MCGIAGVIGSSDTGVVRRMTEVIRHRGPDDHGILAFERLPGIQEAVLGYQRLSIIDLSKAGNQPMCNEDGTLWTVFNGEIYNFADLRLELERAGHRFASHTDTEVVLHGYEEWGGRCVERFVGMFAYALLDTRRGELLLVRDRLGVKPLYYVGVNGTFAFASEIKALLEVPGVPREIDAVGLDLYLALGYVPSPRTLFREVRKLPPGHMLRLSTAGMQVEEYWRLPPPTPTDEPFEEQVEGVRRLLEASVASRMVSDVPVGCLLSGGLDSSTVSALMARTFGPKKRLETFCVGYESSDSRHHEHPFAAVVGRHLGARHHEIICTNEFAVDALPSLIWHMDEPTGDDLMAPYALVCQLARRDVKVVLSGEGSDEFMFGYRYYCLENVRRWARLIPGPLRSVGREMMVRMADGDSFRNRALRACLGDSEMHSFLEWSACLSHRECEDLIGSGYRVNGHDRETRIREALGQPPGGGPHWAPGLDGRFRMVDFILNRTDKLSMAVGLEAREPFLDHRLIEYLARVPMRRQIKGFEGKQLLRHAVKDLLPVEIVWRRKKAFGAPVEEWLVPLSRRYLRDSRLVAEGILRGPAVRQWAEPPLQGGIVSAKVWALIALEIWFRVFIQQDPATTERVLAGSGLTA
jgi:asparagine synthase (glutamine-hydrolysing)